MALPGSDVSTVVMNTSWHFLASVAISVHPVPAGNTLGVSPEAGGRVRRVALSGEVVKAVPHRHAVLSIPKILRGIFFTTAACFLTFPPRRDGWEALKAFYTTGIRDQKAVPGAVVAIQTFGDFPLGFHPHLHILVSDGCFHENGMFSVSPAIDCGKWGSTKRTCAGMTDN